MVSQTYGLAQGDDYGRLGELLSLTLTDRYPLVHFANEEYLLSHYYCALYPMAFLKLAIPAMTLKDAILVGNLLYHVLNCIQLGGDRRALVPGAPLLRNVSLSVFIFRWA